MSPGDQVTGSPLATSTTRPASRAAEASRDRLTREVAAEGLEASLLGRGQEREGRRVELRVVEERGHVDEAVLAPGRRPSRTSP